MSGFQYIESKRVSKAQKRRDAKAAKKADQSKRIEEAERADEHKDRRLEQESLNRLLKARGLMVHDVEADGDCLYRAVEHQLALASDTDQRFTFKEVREQTCRYMLDNEDDFIPFLVDDKGDLMSKQGFIEYCNRIANTKEWGGHLELVAISNFTGKPVHVHQANSNQPLVIDPKPARMRQGDLKRDPKEPILLSFHQHLYHLGAHYNSLVKAVSGV